MDYKVIEVKDFSHALAKRYGAQIVSSSAETEDIREIVRTETTKLQKRYKKVDVVWLDIGRDMSDVRTCNWLAQSEWISLKLPEKHRPLRFTGKTDRTNGIVIKWNENYEAIKRVWEKREVTTEYQCPECGKSIHPIAVIE